MPRVIKEELAPMQTIKMHNEEPAPDYSDWRGYGDDELLEAIAQGDRSAFAILMRRYMSKMLMLAHRIVFDREAAQEIAQEAFLRVWQHACKWNPGGSATFATWLHCVVVNLAISYRRRYREQVDVGALDDLPDMQANGFDHIVTSDRKRVMEEGLKSLSARQRIAIALFYYGDISQIEAAEAMRLTPKAFDSLLVRARRSLKKRLGAIGVFGTVGSI